LSIAPTPVLPHLRDLVLQAVIGALQIGVDHRAEILRRQIERWAGDLFGGVVDGDVEPPEARNGGRDETLDIRLLRNVRVLVEAFPAKALDLDKRLRASVIVDVAQSEFRAPFGESSRQHAAEALRGAGYQNDLVIEIEHLAPLW